ncbi:MAG: hypothetical protein BWY59_00103 [Verrucomicrobia bacterium ADurb.Bin345]|nr:MAG: hypothetical protein BWY59_00103 [Verrucomicrobia bacterium ADurb.Bin345]
MPREPAVGQVAPAGSQRDGHLRGADAAHLLPEGIVERQRLKRARSGRVQPDLALQRVGVGQAQRTARSVDLQARKRRGPYVKRQHQVDRRPARGLQERRKMRVRLDRKPLPAPRPRAEGALGVRAAADRLNPSNAAEHQRQRGDVVRAHVQMRAAAGLIVERGVRVPPLVPPRAPERGGGERPSDPARFDGGAGGLYAGAEHRIRRAPDRQAAPVRLGEYAVGVLKRQRQRLFAVDVLPGAECLERELRVGRGVGQVDHHFDRGVPEHVGHGRRLDAELRSARKRLFRARVRAADDLDRAESLLEALEIDLADHAAADDACFDRLHPEPSLLRSRAVSSPCRAPSARS